MSSFVHIVNSIEQNKRLDALLADAGCYESRSQAAKMIEEGKVFVNGMTVSKSYKAMVGDAVVYEELVKKSFSLAGEPIDLDIRYEDEYMLVISKQAGLICHPSANHSYGTLVNALVHRYGHENLAHVQGDERPGIVHRLDGDTSGLMLCAMDDEVGYALQDAIRLKNVDRRYLALVHGNVPFDTGEIDAPIARNEKTRVSMLVSDGPTAREALTTFKVLERFESSRKDEGYTLVECKLYTGRTHQIRVHMKYIKHCIVGDLTYGALKPAAQLDLDRQFLHSYKLGFEHPITFEQLSFTDTLPEDLKEAYLKIKDRSIGRTEYGQQVLEEIGLA